MSTPLFRTSHSMRARREVGFGASPTRGQVMSAPPGRLSNRPPGRTPTTTYCTGCWRALPLPLSGTEGVLWEVQPGLVPGIMIRQSAVWCASPSSAALSYSSGWISVLAVGASSLILTLSIQTLVPVYVLHRVRRRTTSRARHSSSSPLNE